VGANALLGYLTDPARFTDGTGHLDVDEQLITWADVRFGFDAISSMAADRYSPEAIWAAFRALTTLQGVWDGKRNPLSHCPSCFCRRICAPAYCRRSAT
jgi:hypothetical protein